MPRWSFFLRVSAVNHRLCVASGREARCCRRITPAPAKTRRTRVVSSALTPAAADAAHCGLDDADFGRASPAVAGSLFQPGVSPCQPASRGAPGPNVKCQPAAARALSSMRCTPSRTLSDPGPVFANALPPLQIDYRDRACRVALINCLLLGTRNSSRVTKSGAVGQLPKMGRSLGADGNAGSLPARTGPDVLDARAEKRGCVRPIAAPVPACVGLARPPLALSKHYS